MAFANFQTQQIHCKVLYCGAIGSGKSTNLRSILQQTSPDIQRGDMELAPPNFSTFSPIEFLPISIGRIKNHHLKAHLYCLPPSYLYPSFYSVLFKGLDGLIFVADSSPYQLDANIEALKYTQSLLQKEGLLLSEIPALMQYNKQDLQDALPMDILRHHLNTLKLPEQCAQAHTGEGVMESLEYVISRFTERILHEASHTENSSTSRYSPPPRL